MKIVYFYHIPKCGGSYIMALLKKFAKISNGEFISFTNLGPKKKVITFDQKLIKFIQSLKDTRKGKVLIIHHHHGFPGISELYDHLYKAKEAIRQKGGEMVIFSVIREPLSFITSRVNYLKEKGYNFNRIINNEDDQNYMSKYLLYNHLSRWSGIPIKIDIQLLQNKLELFDFIFLTHKMYKVIDFLNLFLGTTNITIKKKINIGDIQMFPTQEHNIKLLEVNALDVHLYNLAKQKEESYTFHSTIKQSFLEQVIQFFQLRINSLLYYWKNF